jgi:hypothetical protein
MSESFVPLVPPVTRPREAAFASMPFNGLTPGAAPDASAPGNAGSEACSKPVVTLQRNGESVSGIRIQCGCGQVIDLACVY